MGPPTGRLFKFDFFASQKLGQEFFRGWIGVTHKTPTLFINEGWKEPTNERRNETADGLTGILYTTPL